MRQLSVVAFGHRYRLELLLALARAGDNQGICLSLLGDRCGVKPGVYYPPVKSLAAAGMVRSTGRLRPGRRVLYARTEVPVWTGLQRMVEDLPVDIDLGDAAMDWPVAA
jgi:hypothetical protein